MSRYPEARFLTSAHAPDGFVADSGAEVAFTGRSNSGKSSAINAIVGRGDLARTSRTPGRTQQVNFFEIARGWRLVDLPGYGFAKVPPAVRARWRELMDAYFRGRASLAGLVIVADARRGFAGSDAVMLRYAEVCGCPAHVLLTKSDKLTRNEARSVLGRVAGELGDRARTQLFSAPGKEGVDAARAAIEALLARRR